MQSMIAGVKHSALVIAGICLLVSRLSAQDERFYEAWRWAGFTTESGLPSDRVRDVVETGDGTVWVVTMFGLAWYDGFRWNQIDSSAGAPVQRIQAAKRFGSHQLILRCDRKWYVGDRNGFAPLPISDAYAVAPLTANSLLVERNSSILILQDGRLQPFTPSSRLTEGKTSSVWDTKGGSVWANLFSGMYRLEGGEWKLKIACETTPGVVSFLAEDTHGTGITYLTYPFAKMGLWEWYNGSMPVRSTIERPDNVKSLDIGEDGEAVVAYQSGDVKIRQNRVWAPLPLMNPDIRDVAFVKFRSNRDLWVGTEHGLFLYRRSSSRWRFLKHESPDLRNYANELVKTRDGSLWVGTSDGIEVHRPGNAVQYITSINSRRLYVVTGLAEDRYGQIWVSSGSSFDGAYRWDGSRWAHFDVSPSPEGVRIHKIRKDREGRLWFLGLGKNFPGPDHGEPGSFLQNDTTFIPWGEKEGLINGRVYAFCEGKDGALWFGTARGLSRWKPGVPVHRVPHAGEGAWTHWTLAQGLHTGRVFALALDSTQRLWFGDPSTVGVGVGYIDQNDSIHYITVADGLINDYIWDLSVDSKGRLWVATGDGLCCYAGGRWSIFDRQSGLAHSVLWPLLPLDREVCVGTQGGGVAILDMDASSTPEPRIRLDVPRMEGKNILLRWQAFSYWGELDPTEIMTRYKLRDGDWSAWSRMHEQTLVDLDPGEYAYRVQARGLFGNYLAEGAGGSFFVPFPMYLRPGFLIPTGILLLAVVALGVVHLVRKRHHDIALRKSEAKFRTVTEMTSSAIFIFKDFQLLFVNSGAENLTGFTQSELLRMSYLDLIHPDDQAVPRREELSPAAGVPVPRRYEVRIITQGGRERWVDCSSGWIQFQGEAVRLATAFDITERKQAEGKLRSLASELSLTEERERRRMATYLHDVIGQTLALSKMKIRGLERTGLPPVHQQSLEAIRVLIDQSITDTQTLTFELCPPILYELSFEAAIEWLTERMESQHGIAIEFHNDRHPKKLSEEVKVLLFHAVREVLVNIIKHAEARRAVVLLSHLDGSMQIEITDDGKGFDMARKSGSSAGGGGFGLFNIRERLAYLGGNLEIKSQAGEGTRVTITSPLQIGEA